jgi:thiaminase (transcriptional activator TenA)
MAIQRLGDGGRRSAAGTFLHREWITIHANQQFDAFVAWLRDQPDRDGPRLSPDRQEHIAEVFCRTVQLEKAFFDDAYGGT